MEDKKLNRVKPHNVMLENREKLNVTGIRDVVSFDENTIVLSTELGGLVLKGTNLHINKLNVEDGNLNIEGFITSLNYTDKNDKQKSGSIFSNIFK